MIADMCALAMTAVAVAGERLLNTQDCLFVWSSDGGLGCGGGGCGVGGAG